MKKLLKKWCLAQLFLFVAMNLGIFPLLAQNNDTVFPVSFVRQDNRYQNVNVDKQVQKPQPKENSKNFSIQGEEVLDISPINNDENIATIDQKTEIDTTQKSIFFLPNIEKTDHYQKVVDNENPKSVKDLTEQKEKEMIFFAKNGQVSLENVVNLVVNWHPAIKRSMNEVSKSEESIDEAKSGYFPSLKAGVESSYEKSTYSDKRELEHNLVVSLTQNIYDFGKTSSKVALAEATLLRDQFSQSQTVNSLLKETTSAYVEVIRYHNLVNIAKEQVEGFKLINNIAKRRSSLGVSAYSDYSQSQVRVASAQASLHDYTAQYLRWSATLDNLANQKIANKLPLSFPNNIINACELIEIENLTSPDIKMAEAQIDVAKAQLDRVKSDAYPTLSISPTYEYRLDNNYNKYYKNNDRGSFGIFLNVSMQIMEGGGMNARIREAEYSLAASEYNLNYEKTLISQKIMESSSQIKSIMSSLQAYENKVSSAIKTRDLYKEQYTKLGTRQFSDLINAEAEIHQTRMEIINNQYTVQKLSIECMSNSGSLESRLITSSSQMR